LDFSISMSTESARSARSRAADAFKAAVTTIPAKLRPFTIVEAVSGANGSKQYFLLFDTRGYRGDTEGKGMHAEFRRVRPEWARGSGASHGVS
jgi:hypothetical protein